MNHRHVRLTVLWILAGAAMLALGMLEGPRALAAGKTNTAVIAASAAPAAPQGVSDVAGACCEPDGSCQILAEGPCLTGGGVNWMIGSSCQNTCPAVGSCCLGDGTCCLMIEGACDRDEGSFAGIGGACNPNACATAPRAGYCEDCLGVIPNCTTKEHCDKLGGHWVPARACEIGPVGACCVGSNGICMIETTADCDSLHGLFEGSQSSCMSAPCPGGPPLGQCCYADGHCATTSDCDCALTGGVNWVSQRDCSRDCAPVGACCLPDGTCMMVIRLDCEDNHGTFLGRHATCDPSPCAAVPVRAETWGSIKARYQ